MKVVRLALSLTFAMVMAAASVNAQERAVTTETASGEIKMARHTAFGVNKDDCQNEGSRNSRLVRQECPLHGKHCRHNCLKNSFGYGQAAVCPQNGHQPCPIHGYGACPVHGQGLLQGIRNATAWSDQPHFGDRPLFAKPGYGPHGHYVPGPPAHGAYGGYQGYQDGYHGYAAVQGPMPTQGTRWLPKVRTFIYGPQVYMTTRPAEPLPVYTTRGPRDFLAPNPPSIGY